MNTLLWYDEYCTALGVGYDEYSHRVQALTLSNLDHWPRGPVDLRSYWPEGQYI